jgi:hypothetical protein
MVTLIHNDDSWKRYLCGSESPAQLGTKITATCHVTASQDDEPGSWAMRISPRCYNRLIYFPNNKGRIVSVVQHFFGLFYPSTKLFNKSNYPLPVWFFFFLMILPTQRSRYHKDQSSHERRDRQANTGQSIVDSV